ncbi:helix-turn-helix transcriptional regulator, partial [Streptomyces sp. MBT97]|uniref:helix-turn-helix transcriptional regulator n=1 Tax=Streptomyces sp. MBT97 TaxID=2800411 RepID=UPI001F1AAE73
MASQEELFASVDALLEEEPQLPLPAERARLREEAGITQARLAQVLKTTPQTVKNWENGRSEPRPPRLEAYQRLLEGWAAKYPKAAPAAPAQAQAPGTAPVPGTDTALTVSSSPAPAPGTRPAPAPGSVPAPGPAPAPASVAAAVPAAEAGAVQVPAAGVRSGAPQESAPAGGGAQPAPGAAVPSEPRTPEAPARRPARTVARTAAPAGADPRFPHGPLVVLDGDGAGRGG